MRIRPRLYWNTLDIPKGALERGPFTWEQYVGGERFTFTLEWNAVARLPILAIAKDGEELFRTAINYGWDLAEPYQYMPEVSGLKLVAFDPGLTQLRANVTKDNLGGPVRIFYIVEAT